MQRDDISPAGALQHILALPNCLLWTGCRHPPLAVPCRAGLHPALVSPSLATSLHLQATNIKFHDGMVPRETKEQLLGQKGVVLWFTGEEAAASFPCCCCCCNFLLLPLLPALVVYIEPC